MTIGQRVRKLRIEKGMTQTELAEKLGYKSKSSVAHIENGRDIPRSMVVKLSDILDTTPSYLMGWEDEKSAPAVEDSKGKKIKEIMEIVETLDDSGLELLDSYLSVLVEAKRGGKAEG